MLFGPSPSMFINSKGRAVALLVYRRWVCGTALSCLNFRPQIFSTAWTLFLRFLVTPNTIYYLLSVSCSIKSTPYAILNPRYLASALLGLIQIYWLFSELLTQQVVGLLVPMWSAEVTAQIFRANVGTLLYHNAYHSFCDVLLQASMTVDNCKTMKLSLVLVLINSKYEIHSSVHISNIWLRWLRVHPQSSRGSVCLLNLRNLLFTRIA